MLRCKRTGQSILKSSRVRNIALLLLCIALFGCSEQKKLRRAERKIERLTIKYPQLLQKDTIIDTVQVVVPKVEVDTFFDANQDTVVINNDKLTIRYIKVGDTVLIQGECKQDTIYQRVEIPFEKVVVREQTLIEQLGKAGKLGLALLIVLLIALFLWKLTNPLKWLR